MPEPTFGSRDAQDVVLDVVAGELAAGVELDALAQVELELLEVGADVPAFGQHRLRLEIEVVRGQAVEDQPRGLTAAAGDAVAVDADGSGRLRVSQRAAELGLASAWQRCGAGLDRARGRSRSGASGWLDWCWRGGGRRGPARREQEPTRTKRKQTQRLTTVQLGCHDWHLRTRPSYTIPYTSHRDATPGAGSGRKRGSGPWRRTE